ncbi:holo-ACP synthase [Nitrosophilus kaiyonis]|uniref:holo-ACP synthase n=1 Tax=Nitrosophilus kaiyonis TaxID=2930200 RepID=UPI002491ADBC|nr:holo-ACP synthase [Nitrosophilus kaiyonis]
MIGVDLVKIERIKKMIDKFGEKALKRYLNDNEIKMVKKIESAAGYWAAKEAIAKALKTGIGKELNFKDIELYKEKSGAVNFKLPERFIKKYNICDTSLSISHDGGFAIAVAVIESSSSHKC